MSLAVIAVALLGFGLLSRRAARSLITPPLAFTAIGWLAGSHGLGLVAFDVDHGLIRTLAEVTLVLVLFGDASRIDLMRLERQRAIPIRLLTIGLPLTIVLGTFLARLVPGLTFWEGALAAAILSPTDATLGQAVVSSPRVPVRIRQSLNVESGLNDGIMLPAILGIACLATTASHESSVVFWTRFVTLQLVLGPLIGGLVGFFGGRAVSRATRSGSMGHDFQSLSAIAIALLAFAGAELAGGNGFIAAFVAGLVLGNTSRDVCGSLYDFAETEGQLLTLLVFLVFGGALAPEAIASVSLPIALFALLALTVMRMVPVALSLTGLRLRPDTIGFIGWFGPRGVASILFVLAVMEETPLEGSHTITHVVMLTVLASVVLHGITANPGAEWYARRLETGRAHPAAEMERVSEHPTRLGKLG